MTDLSTFLTFEKQNVTKMSKKNKTTKDSNKSQQIHEPLSPQENLQKKMDWVYILLILVATYFSFSAVRGFEFVNWDDDKNFYENELITSLNKDNFAGNSKKNIFRIGNRKLQSFIHLDLCPGRKNTTGKAIIMDYQNRESGT